MVKMVSGILARDKKPLRRNDPDGRGGSIVFFRQWNPYVKEGIWLEQSFNVKEAGEWTVAEWKATYNLKPPAPGRYFEVEIEL